MTSPCAQDMLFIENEIDRVSIGSTTDGMKRNPDGWLRARVRSLARKFDAKPPGPVQKGRLLSFQDFTDLTSYVGFFQATAKVAYFRKAARGMRSGLGDDDLVALVCLSYGPKDAYISRRAVHCCALLQIENLGRLPGPNLPTHSVTLIAHLLR